VQQTPEAMHKQVNRPIVQTLMADVFPKLPGLRVNHLPRGGLHLDRLLGCGEFLSLIHI